MRCGLADSRKSFDVARLTVRMPESPSPVCLRRWHPYCRSDSDQKAMFCESNMPSVMSGDLRTLLQRRPSGETHPTSPDYALPPRALNRSA